MLIPYLMNLGMLGAPPAPSDRHGHVTLTFSLPAITLDEEISTIALSFDFPEAVEVEQV